MPAGFLEASLSELLCMDAFPFPPGGGGNVLRPTRSNTYAYTYAPRLTHTWPCVNY